MPSLTDLRVLLGLVVHVVLFLAVFDVYFHSPILTGVPPVKNDLRPICQRLVLIVCDGLRADRFFEKSGEHIPFIRSIIQTRGSWGISQTRVPTESRPGHVAIIAGLYEDPSAVFQGWKDNPVPFDSVFNQSAQTFSWGSPDIVPLFSRGSAKNHVHTESYSANDQDFFGNSDSLELNRWVLQRFTSFIRSPPAHHDIHKDRTVFFLHLLSTDVIGHVDKPASDIYTQSIVLTDEIVKEVTSLVGSIFDDGLTSFIFTSDHGMTDWGSHGAGSTEETHTPIVAWGCGIHGPVPVAEDNSPADWGLSKFKRRDINQADIAPLMSVLLGIPIPVNSVGILPVTYLNSPKWALSKYLYLNARQILTQYEWKKSEVKRSTLKPFFVDFPLMSTKEQVEIQSRIEYALNDSSTTGIIRNSSELIHVGLSGLEYYQNYFSSFQLLSVTATFIGWGFYLMSYLVPHYDLDYRVVKPPVTLTRLINLSFIAVLTVAMLIVFVQQMPFQYYIYVGLPSCLWWATCLKFCGMNILQIMGRNYGKVLIWSLVYAVTSAAIVLTFVQREILSVIMLMLALWPYSNKALEQENSLALKTWLFSCFGLAIFPLLPTVGFYQSFQLVFIAGCVWLVIGLAILVSPVAKYINKKLFCFNLLLIVITLLNLASINLKIRSLVFRTNPYHISWILLAVSVMIAPMGSGTLVGRFIGIVFSMAVPYLLLSTGHEAFFPLVLVSAIISWVILEHQLSNNKGAKLGELTFENFKRRDHKLTREDIRRCFFYIIFIVLSFFGIGNIASINSFDVSWVKAFLEVFSPFIMMILILFKTVIPFFMVTVAFRYVNLIRRVKPHHMFMIVLLICNAMSLGFFHRISNKGSWLDIGTSISHYVIIQTMTIVLVLLYWVALSATYVGSNLFSSLEAPVKKAR